MCGSFELLDGYTPIPEGKTFCRRAPSRTTLPAPRPVGHADCTDGSLRHGLVVLARLNMAGLTSRVSEIAT